MLATYDFDTTALNLVPGLQTPNNQHNLVLGGTLGDTKFVIQAGVGTQAFEIPAKALRNGGVSGSGLIPSNTGRGPHQDYLFMRDSVEYTYVTRLLTGGGVIEKQMPVGAQVGDEGRMILYKGCTTLSDAIMGNWTERLIRVFLITAADLTNRDTGWPATGAVPTVNVASKSVVDNSGNGYNHI